jgi:phospholipid-binding lipoprotein MlaA
MEPLTVRDGLGKLVDAAMDPLSYMLPFSPVRLSLTAASKVNERALNDESFEAMEDSVLDLYSAVRNGYLQRREHLLLE